MPNPLYNDQHAPGGKGGKVNMGKQPKPSYPERTINWPGLPGPSGPGNKSSVSPKVKVHPVTKGM